MNKKLSVLLEFVKKLKSLENRVKIVENNPRQLIVKKFFNSIKDAEIENNNLFLTMFDGKIVNAGKVKEDPIPGKKGEPGKKGKPGDPGLDGLSIELTRSNDVVFWKKENSEVLNPLFSIDEIKGKPGKKGKPGDPGLDGCSIKDIITTNNGEIIIHLSDGREISVGRINLNNNRWMGGGGGLRSQVNATPPIVYDPNSGNFSLNPLTVADFDSPDVSQWNNDAGYITSGDLSGYVPYIGATQNVNLGTRNLFTTGIISGKWQGDPIAIDYGGTGETTANAALNALLPDQALNNGKFLSTDGTNTSWVSDVSFTGGNGINITGSTISADINTTNLEFSESKIKVKDNVVLSTARFTSLVGGDGKFLTTDFDGNLLLSDFSSQAVTSVTGTAGQVLVNGVSGSAQQGAVTLTLPQDITFDSVTVANLAGYFIKKSNGINAQVLLLDSTNPDNLYIGSSDITGDTYFQNGNGIVNHGALLAGGNWVFGAVISGGGKINSLATTEQIRASFDAITYASITVNSSGNLTLAPTGTSTTITSDLTITRSSTGSVGGRIQNTNSTSGANARLIINTAVGGGDPFIYFNTAASADFSLGIDKSDSNIFKISNSSGLGTNDLVALTTSGNLGLGTNPLARTYLSAGTHNFSMASTTGDRCTQVLDSADQRLTLGAYWQSGVGQYAYIQASNNAETSFTDLLLNPGGGNVGIGGNPTAGKVHIQANGGYTLALEDTTAPQLTFYQGNGAVDNKRWKILAANENLYMTAINDGDTVGTTWLEVQRTGTTIDEIVFANGNVGIGVNPTAGKALHIYRNLIGETNLLLEGAAANAFSVTQLQLKNDTANLFNITMYSSVYITVADRNAVVINNGAGELRLGGSGGTAINIETNNNVTVSGGANQVLQIAGTAAAFLRMRDNSASTNNKICDIISDEGNYIFRQINDDGSAKREPLIITNSGWAVFGGGSASGQLTSNQNSASGGIPALYLSQADTSRELIEFNATIGTGNAIEAVGAKTLTVTHFIRVNIGTVGFRYLPVGTIA